MPNRRYYFSNDSPLSVYQDLQSSWIRCAQTPLKVYSPWSIEYGEPNNNFNLSSIECDSKGYNCTGTDVISVWQRESSVLKLPRKEQRSKEENKSESNQTTHCKTQQTISVPTNVESPTHDNYFKNLDDDKKELDNLQQSQCNSCIPAGLPTPLPPPPSILSRDRRGHAQFYFTSCQWTPDGSSLLTTSSDHIVRIFVAPEHLLSSLSSSSAPSLDLLPYARIPFPSAVTASAIYPEFKISQYAPALVLISTADHPIKLYNVHTQKSVASYFLTNPNTEAFDNSLALAFPCGSESMGMIDYTRDNDDFGWVSQDMFLAGTTAQRGRVDLFNLLRPGSSSMASAYIPKKHKSSNLYRRAIVSAIAPKPLSSTQGTPYIAAIGFYQGGGVSQKSGGEHGSGVALYDFRIDNPMGRCTVISPQTSPSSNFGSERYSWRRYISGTTRLLWNPPGSASGCEHLVYQIPRNGFSNIIVRDARMELQEIGVLLGSEELADFQNKGNNGAFPDNNGRVKIKPTQQRLGADWIRSSWRRRNQQVTVSGKKNKYQEKKDVEINTKMIQIQREKGNKGEQLRSQNSREKREDPQNQTVSKKQQEEYIHAHAHVLEHQHENKNTNESKVECFFEKKKTIDIQGGAGQHENCNIEVALELETGENKKVGQHKDDKTYDNIGSIDSSCSSTSSSNSRNSTNNIHFSTIKKADKNNYNHNYNYCDNDDYSKYYVSGIDRSDPVAATVVNDFVVATSARDISEELQFHSSEGGQKGGDNNDTNCNGVNNEEEHFSGEVNDNNNTSSTNNNNNSCTTSTCLELRNRNKKKSLQNEDDKDKDCDTTEARIIGDANQSNYNNKGGRVCNEPSLEQKLQPTGKFVANISLNRNTNTNTNTTNYNYNYNEDENDETGHYNEYEKFNCSFDNSGKSNSEDEDEKDEDGEEDESDEDLSHGHSNNRYDLCVGTSAGIVYVYRDVAYSVISEIEEQRQKLNDEKEGTFLESVRGFRRRKRRRQEGGIITGAGNEEKRYPDYYEDNGTTNNNNNGTWMLDQNSQEKQQQNQHDYCSGFFASSATTNSAINAQSPTTSNTLLNLLPKDGTSAKLYEDDTHNNIRKNKRNNVIIDNNDDGSYRLAHHRRQVRIIGLYNNPLKKKEFIGATMRGNNHAILNNDNIFINKSKITCSPPTLTPATSSNNNTTTTTTTTTSVCGISWNPQIKVPNIGVLATCAGTGTYKQQDVIFSPIGGGTPTFPINQSCTDLELTPIQKQLNLAETGITIWAISY